MPDKYLGEEHVPPSPEDKIIPRWFNAKENEENKKGLANRRKWMEEALGAGLGAGVGGAGVGGAGLKKAAKKRAAGAGLEKGAGAGLEKVIPKLPKHWRNKPFI